MIARKLGHPFVSLYGQKRGAAAIPMGAEVAPADVGRLPFDKHGNGTADARTRSAFAAKSVWHHMNHWAPEAREQLKRVLGPELYLKACAFAARERTTT